MPGDEKNGIRVSVVMPVYNAEKFLRQALDSLLAQSMREFELICVDDGSTDGSYGLLLEYEKRDGRVRAIKNETKSDGAGLARNIGLRAAAGKYVIFLDADDFFERELLQCAYDRLEETCADIVIFDAYWYDDMQETVVRKNADLHRSELPPEEVFSPKECADRIFQISNNAPWLYMYKRDFLFRNDLFFQQIHYTDDVAFTNMALACAGKIAVLKKNLVYYRVNTETNQTAGLSKWPESAYLPLLEIQSQLVKKNLYQTYQISFVRLALNLILYYLDSITVYESFERLYYDLKNTYMERLGLFDIPDDRFDNPARVERRNAIRDCEITEYLFLGDGGIRRSRVYENALRRIPALGRIALYGAGDVGRAVAARLFAMEGIKVCGWYDKQYASLGYPVLSPEKITEQDFDTLIIAVEDEKLFRAIKRELIGRGITEESVLWIWDINEYKFDKEKRGTQV